MVRTIQSLQNVESARVHLALPPESLFIDETKEPSASVVLRLRGSGILIPNQVRAIANLVASGVDGLKPSNVSIIDGHGRMMSGAGETADSAMSASQTEAKRNMEETLERTLLSIQGPAGPGKLRSGHGGGQERGEAEIETKRRRAGRSTGNGFQPPR